MAVVWADGTRSRDILRSAAGTGVWGPALCLGQHRRVAYPVCIQVSSFWKAAALVSWAIWKGGEALSPSCWSHSRTTRR